MKRIAAMALTLMLVLGLAACTATGGTATQAPTQASAQTSQATQAASETPAPTEAPYYNTDSWPIVNDPITLKVMGPKSAAHAEWKDMDIFLYITEQTNISFEFDTPASDAFTEKKNLAFASKNLPDLFIGSSISSSEVVKYGVQEGLLVRIEDYLDLAPHIQEQYATYPEIYASIVAEDGYSYAIPNIGVPVWTMTSSHLFMNNKWLEAVGLDIPTTTDEYLEALRAFKAGGDLSGNGKADEIPAVWTTGYRTDMLSAFGILTNSFEMLRDTGEVVFSPITDNYKAYLQFMSTLWEEGLLDIDSFSQTGTEIKAKATEGRYGSFTSIASFVVAPAEMILDFDMLTPLTSEYNSQPLQNSNSAFTPGQGAITSVNPYPEATILLIDWMYTQKGSLDTNYGPHNWAILDNGAHAFIKADGTYGVDNTYRSTLTIADMFPRSARATLETYEKFYLDAENNYNNSVLYTQWSAHALPYAYNPAPKVVMTADETEDILAIADLKSYVEQMEAKFITGELDIDATWDEYVNTCKSMDYDRMLAAYTSAWTRYAQTIAED